MSDTPHSAASVAHLRLPVVYLRFTGNPMLAVVAKELPGDFTPKVGNTVPL